MEILETERRHLEETLAIVRDELRKTQQALGMENGEDRMVMAQDDGSSDSVVALQLMRMNLQTLHQLRLSVRSPYFARLDFTPAPGTPALGGLRPGVNAPLYIGRWGVLQTPEYRVCVYDWRSPVANLYYSGQMGPVSYEAPDGSVKGLEFDCAVIADAEDAVYPDERFYARLFYVLCTRPLHRLAFVHGAKPARHLPPL